MSRAVYSAWDGTQDHEAYHAEDLLHALMHDLLRYGDLDWALRELLRRGYTTPDGRHVLRGFDDILQHLTQQKHQALRRYASDAWQFAASQVEPLQQQIATLVARAENASPTPDSSAPDHSLVTLAHTIRDMLSQRTQTSPAGQAGRPGQESEVLQHLQHELQELQQRLTLSLAADQQPSASLPQHDTQTVAVSPGLAAFQTLHAYLQRVQHVAEQWQTLAFTGTECPGLDEAERLLRALQYLETIAQRLRWGVREFSAGAAAALLPLLNVSRSQQVQQLQQLEDRLEEAGVLRRTDSGLQLTPQAIRRLAAQALHDLFRPAWRRGFGPRRHMRHASNGAPLGDTKPYLFGAPFAVDLQQTFANVIRRQPQLPLRLCPQDFMIYPHEPLLRSATVILLDMSHSMELFGAQRFFAAKKVALALTHLMHTRFPHDVLHIAGFGTRVRPLLLHDLPYVSVVREHTNTQAGLQFARTLLSRYPHATKHIVLITDGRPTAVQINGQLHLHTWELHSLIVEETYKEAKRCRQQQIALTTFMVADDEPLVAFVQRLTAVSQGRALYTTPERLGDYVIEDYLRRQHHGI